MPPLPSRALVLAVLGLAAVGLGLPLPAAEGRVAPRPARWTTGWLTGECPEGTLPDGDVCVRLLPDETREGVVVANQHRVRTGVLASYEQIPRRPDRPADYDAYRYPVAPGLPGGRSVQSGYDLDQPDARQRRGPRLRATGHGGVDLPQRMGEPVRMVPLEGQRGDADVVYVGPLFGTTVVTRHTVAEGGALREYLLLFGHLQRPAPGLTRGAPVPAGGLVGFVGDTGSPELVHLHLEARRVRDGVAVAQLEGSRLLAPDVSIVCDPRNVLPLREGAGP